MSIFHRCSLLFLLGFMSACQEQVHPCDDKLVVLPGTGLIEVTTQWDACVARRASRLAGSQVEVEEIASSAISFCSNHREAYRLAQLRCLVHETDERLRREGRDPDALSDEVWTTLYNFPTVEDAKATLNDTRSEPATRLEAQRRVALG